MATPRCSAGYSSNTAEKTLEWMNAIDDFIRPFRSLIDAHVVNFFKDRLWETVDEDWMACLRKEPVENLLGIPSGLVMNHWPTSFQELVLTIKSLAISRDQEPLNKLFSNSYMASISGVLAQGMNEKKKHEVEHLAAVINSIASDVGAQKIIDVGAGQGYLAQVLSFEYQLPVVAIDASSHHSSVTSKRAERIKKHYLSKLRKSQNEMGAGDKQLNIPQAVTCHVLSSSALSALSLSTVQKDHREEMGLERNVSSEDQKLGTGTPSFYSQTDPIPLVLAGLHACGDLTVNMLRAFVECEQAKALVCVGCCYNLLSDELDWSISPCGFPVSNGAKIRGFTLTKNARDLACQSADRWRNLSNDGALQNFDLHVFRAAFQMVLEKYYPDVMFSTPSIGRQGKALRRQQRQRELHMRHNVGESLQITSGLAKESDPVKAEHAITNSLEREENNFVMQDRCRHSRARVPSCCCGSEYQEGNIAERCDKYSDFEEFVVSALGRLGFKGACDIDLLSVWKGIQPFLELVGPYWSLRASFGPLLETYLLLDRLLFLQEQGNSVDVMMFPIFDPLISPRNIAIIARK